MTPNAPVHRLNRRLFLRELGGGGIAIAVLGSAALASCSSAGNVVLDGGDASATSAPASTAPATTTPAADPTAVPGDATAVTASEPAEDVDAPVDETLRWEQVSFGFVSAYVIARGREVAIVDTGTAGGADQITGALTTLGASWGDVDHVVLTHLHGDHVGGLPDVLDRAPDATAWAGEADVAGININSPRPISGLVDGDEVFGLQVIATPGHTPGHIALLDPAGQFLVAGDALNTDSAGLVLGPNPSFTPDMDTANASVQRLAQRQFETVMVGHGPPILTAASDAVVALAQTLR